MYQPIRDAYEKAVDGLRSLEAVAEPSESSKTLINEHMVACREIESMDKGVLGGIP